VIIDWTDVLLICIGGLVFTALSVGVLYAVHLEVIDFIEGRKRTKRLTEEGEAILKGSKVLKPEEKCDFQDRMKNK